MKIGDKVIVRWTSCNRQYEGHGEVSKINQKTARVRLMEEVAVQDGAAAYPVGREIIAPIVNDTVGNCIISEQVDDTDTDAADAKFQRIAGEIRANAEWRKLLAGDWHEEMKALEEIAAHYCGENTATGGGIYVVIIPLGPHDAMGVSPECCCKYSNAKLTEPYEIFWEPENDTSEDVISLME